MEILVLLSLVGYVFLSARYTKLPIEAFFLFSVSALISILYFAALFDALKPISIFILTTGWISLAIFAVSFFQLKTTTVLEKYLTPGFFVILFVIIVLGLMAQQLLPYRIDEFTHWAAHAKLIYLFNGLIPADVNTIHKSYPPGGSLFYYPFLLLNGYQIGKAYFAQSLLFLAPLALLVTTISWRHWPRALIILFIGVACLHLLKAQLGGYISLYMDTGVALYWASFVVYNRLIVKKPSQLLFLIPVAVAFCLFKPHLLPLLALALVLIAVQSLLHYKTLNKNLWASWFYLLLIFIAGLLTTKSWGWYLHLTHVHVEWQLPLTLSEMLHALTLASNTSRDAITLRHFFANLSKPLLLALLFTVIAFCLAQINKKPAKTRIILVTQLLLWLGMIAYLFGLLLMYLFSFTVGEGESLASFGRYTHIFYIGWGFILLGEFALATPSVGKLIPSLLEKVIGSGIILLFILAYVYFSYHEYQSSLNPRKIQFYTKTIKTIVQPVLALTPSDSRLFTVWQANDGEPRAMVLYHVLPRGYNNDNFTLGKPYSSNDHSTRDLTSKAFKAHLKNYDYLLLAYTDKQFWHRYGDLFPQTPPDLIPTVTYKLCIHPGFNGINTSGCQLRHLKAYLFKINHKGQTIHLINLGKQWRQLQQQPK